MSDMTVNLSGGELTEGELAKLMETGLECDEAAEEQAADAAAAAAATELINPVTGAIVDIDNIDSLILGCDECKRLLDELNTFYRTLREAAWAKTTGTTKTRRLRGTKYQAKLEEGDKYPSASILSEAWNSYPKYRDEFLKIGSIKLKMREVGKLAGMTSDDPAFGQFKGMIEDAIKNSTQGMPTVSMEREKEG